MSLKLDLEAYQAYSFNSHSVCQSSIPAEQSSDTSEASITKIASETLPKVALTAENREALSDSITYEEEFIDFVKISSLSVEESEDLEEEFAKFHLIPIKHAPVFGNIEEYCIHCSPHISLDQAKDHINQGKELMFKVLSGEIESPSNDPKEAQEQTVFLIWYLMSLAIEKNQGFISGAFIIEDSDQKLNQFLSKCPGLYSRASSHLQKRAISLLQNGIDIKDASNKLPAGKKTILFTQILSRDNQKELFIKIEAEGANILNPVTMFHHSVDLVKTKFNAWWYPTSNESSGMRKERIPHTTLKAFEKIVMELQRHPREALDQEDILQTANPLKEAKIYGISFMHAYLGALKDLPENGGIDKTLFERFDKTIKGLDHLNKRTGREVYLTHDELLQNRLLFLDDVA